MHRAKLMYPRSQHTRVVASTHPRLPAPVKHTATSTPPTEEGAHAITGAPTSNRIRRDRRRSNAPRTRPLHQPCRHSDELQGSAYHLRSQNAT
jgi:hypothetical protein